MQTTSNYDLKKPDGSDTVDIADLNYNADQIDAALTPTADPAQAPTNNGPGKLVQWISWLTNRIKAITGSANWWDAPATTLATANSHIGATSAHSATSAATASRIMMRDAAGRAKVTAPSAADDIARKDTVDAVQTNLASHLADTMPHRYTDAGKTYRWGLKVTNGIASIVYEEVV